jgi:hypothetical protein
MMAKNITVTPKQGASVHKNDKTLYDGHEHNLEKRQQNNTR